MATRWTMLQNRICVPDQAPQALVRTPECTNRMDLSACDKLREEEKVTGPIEL